jgi:hypothetical protein
MAKKTGNFLEQNIDKIVLAVIGLVSLAVLWLMVLNSPNNIDIDRKAYGPGDIDQAISGKASELQTSLAGEVKTRTYKSQLDAFKSMYASAVNPATSAFPVPAPIPEVDWHPVGPYSEPKMMALNKPVAGLVSGVAGVPTGPLMESQTLEPDDVDLVTVECTFVPGPLFANMKTSFGGDTRLQRPYFAAVELQRQELGEDGTWPTEGWQTIRRTKVDPYADILDITNINAMSPTEIKSFRAQLSAQAVEDDVLQPAEYAFMSLTEPWLPPSLFDERERTRRAAAPVNPTGTPGAVMPTQGSPRPRPGSPGTGEGEPAGPTRRQGTTTTRPTTNRPTPATRPGVPGGPGGPGGPGAPGGMGPGGPGAAGAAANTPDVKYMNMRITNAATLENKPLATFWAHDDTVRPGSTYRYRVRLGVLNPIAGRGKSTTDAGLAAKTIFWSEFSKETAPVEIPARMYIFAKNYDKGMVFLDVCKYKLGRWEKKAYELRPGEAIGRVEKMPAVNTGTGTETEVPDVDFTTGMTVVDVESVTEFRPNTTNPVQSYQQLLYKDQSNIIRHAGIKNSAWPKSLKAKYTEIDNYMLHVQPAVPVVYTATTVTTVPSSTPSMPMQNQMGGPGGMREE